MATPRFVGKAQLAAQVRVQTITAYDAATTYTVTIGARTISSVGTGGTVTTTAAALVVLLNASTIPEFAEWTWSNSAGQLIGTKDTAGYAGTWLMTVSGGTGTVGAASNSTANGSPNDVGLAANWSANTLPVNSDTVYFDGNSVAALWNLDALSALTGLTLHVTASYTGSDSLSSVQTAIGLAELNQVGDVYVDYRTLYLTVTATTVHIGAGSGQGVGRLKLDLQAAAATVHIYSTGSRTDVDLPACIIKGTAIVALNLMSGDVGVAIFGSETAAITTLNVGTEASSGVFVGGTGLTVTTLNAYSGEVRLFANPTTLVMKGPGATVYTASGNCTTLTIDAGTHFFLSAAATFTTVKIGAGGTWDLSQGEGAVTVTNPILMDAGATLNDPKGRLVANTQITAVNCRLDELRLNIGTNKTTEIQ